MVNNKLVSAVQLALAAGAVSAVVPTDAALAQQQAAAATAATGLDEIIVTGSHLRRVDAESADPILTLDSATIAQTGAVTVGDLVSRIPSIAGQATNPSINNGGGFGESNIELRGLGAERTLILLDGKRINLLGASNAVDINQIPLNLIEKVEVLKQGAGATYGSDAIGGVVNFITKKHVEGIELTGDWGQSTKHDAQHHNLGILIGGSNERLSFEAGANYNQQDELSMGKRNWSKYALYLYSGSFNKAGSSRSATGRIYLPANLASSLGCASVTLKQLGGPSNSLSDYRCWAGASDKFNFQPYNLNVTPQERAALFTKLNYKVNDYAEVYTSVVYNHTHSGYQIAPLPFDANADQIVISGSSYYNPFGTDFGGGAAVGGANPNFALRLSALGDRRSDTTSTSLITQSGVKGKLGLGDWNYDLSVSYNRLDQVANVFGYINFNTLAQAVGPSFLDSTTGQVTCGTPTAPISTCTPVNIFSLFQPGQSNALSTAAETYTTINTFTTKSVNLDLNGSIVKLPAGDLSAAGGLSYTGLDQTYFRSSNSISQPPLYLGCGISQEACGSPFAGGYNTKEAYLEVGVPILANVPGAEALNLDLGTRYSNYSDFGSVTKSQIKLEWRPIHDILVRGTYSQIFRAPTINDLYAGYSSNSPTFNDPCTGYKGAATAAYPNLPAACQGVATNGTFAEPQNQVTGILSGNSHLKPETGDVKTVGVVFDPSFARGLSVSADWWSYTVNNLIQTLDPNYLAQSCANGTVTAFCSLINRYTTGINAGQVIDIQQPTYNLGTLKTDGVDLNLTYRLPHTPIGDFTVVGDVTKLMSYTDTPAPGAAPQQIAGQYSKQFGFYAKTRGTGTLQWTGWDAQALLTARYIGGVDIPLTNFGPNGYAGYRLPQVWYFDLSGGYELKATHTSFRAGMLNLLDKTPPIGGLNSFGVGSSVTDVTTYDTIGRRFFVGVTQKF